MPADKYNIDHRILPAISVQESSCAKHYPSAANFLVVLTFPLFGSPYSRLELALGAGLLRFSGGIALSEAIGGAQGRAVGYTGFHSVGIDGSRGGANGSVLKSAAT